MFSRRSHALTAALGTAALVGSLLVTGTASAESYKGDELAANSAQVSLKTISFPGDPRFTQLLGINDRGIIAGYHGDENTENTPNKGFTLEVVDNQNKFADENFPQSVQTQVVGIDNNGDTVGFYIDSAGQTHGFLKPNGKDFLNIDLPGTTFNQLLGINNRDQEAGYFQDANNMQHAYVREQDGAFLVLNLPMPSSQATSINDHGTVVGFMQPSNGAATSEGYVLKDDKLTVLQFPGSSFTQALGVNNSDDVVGFYNDANGVTHGFVYDNGNYEQIDAQGAQATTINGINNRNQVVGFSMDQNGNSAGLVGQVKR
jgi:probable HAF family extracellular repeat protein